MMEGPYLRPVNPPRMKPASLEIPLCGKITHIHNLCAVIFLGIGKVLLERGEGRYTGKVFARGTQKVFAKAFLLGAACFLLALYALLYM